MKASHHMRRKRHSWSAQIAVPEPLRAAAGKKVIEIPLNTTDEREARLRRDEALAKWRREFDRLRRVRGLNTIEVQRLRLQKLNAEFEWMRARPWDAEAAMEARLDSRDEQKIAAFLMASDIDPTREAIDRMAAAMGEAKKGAMELYRRGLTPPADSAATPVGARVDQWLKEAGSKERVNLERKRAVKRFEAWLDAMKLPNAMERISRKVAGLYVSEALAGRHHKTAGKQVNLLSGYWTYLERKGYVASNPWTRQAPSKPRATGEETGKRPYTEAEIKTLLDGGPGQPLHDVVRLLALSGMRVEELCRLRLSDCAGGLFKIRGAKTEAGNRDVPIHPDLEPVIRQRSKGRGAGDYLIHELRDPPEGSAKERSHGLVKRFTRYRRGLNLDERPNGQRQSRIDMHSLRRWFADSAARAREADPSLFSAEALSEVMGHVKQGQTAAYAGKRPEELRRACVESVKLPGSLGR